MRRVRRFFTLFLLLSLGLMSNVVRAIEIDFAQQIEIKKLFFEGVRLKGGQNVAVAEDCYLKILKIDSLHHESMYELAMLYMGQGKFAQSLSYAERAASLNPSNKWYLMLLTDLYERSKNYAKVVSVTTQLISLDAGEEKYYENKAIALAEVGRYEDALQEYDVIDEKFGDADESVFMGRQGVYLRQKNFEKAINELQEKIKGNPKEVKYYLLLGDIYQSLRKNGEALSVYMDAKKQNQNYGELYVKCADIYREQKDFNAAADELSMAFRMDGLDVESKIRILLAYMIQSLTSDTLRQSERLSKVILEAHSSESLPHSVYANFLLERGDAERALFEYKESIRLDARNYQAWDGLMRTTLLKEKYDDVISYGLEAISLFPNQISLYYLVSLAYSKEQKYGQAVTYLLAATNIPCDDKNFLSQVWASLADNYHELNESRKSDEAYVKAIEFNPENAYALNNYAYYLSERAVQLDEAEKMSAKSIKIEGNNSAFIDTYAWILFKKKKYKQAKEWMEKVMTMEKDLNSVHFEHYGDILSKTGSMSEAMEQWKKSKKMNNNSPVLDKKINEMKYVE